MLDLRQYKGLTNFFYIYAGDRIVFSLIPFILSELFSNTKKIYSFCEACMMNRYFNLPFSWPLLIIQLISLKYDSMQPKNKERKILSLI